MGSSSENSFSFWVVRLWRMALTNSQPPQGSQETFQQVVRERLRQAVRQVLINVLEEEVTTLIGAEPYERCESRRDQRNGHYYRDLETRMGEILDLPVPRTRGRHQSQLFERYHRRREELDTAMAEMFVAGASQARVGEVMETLTGSKPSPSTVWRVFHSLQSEYEQWKSRRLFQRYAYAFADGAGSVRTEYQSLAERLYLWYSCRESI
jgi:transposase-like protein